MTTATYTITMIDSDTAPAWLSLCADRGGDAGRQHSRTVDGAVQDLYTMTVTTEQPEALESALDADDDVLEYDRTDALDAMIAAIESADDGQRLTGGDTAEETAQAWLDAGVSPEQADAYIEAGCWDADAVASLIAAGVTPAHLGDRDVLARVVADRDWSSRQRGGSGYTAEDVTDGSLAYAHSNGDLSTDEIARAALPVRCECGAWSGERCVWTGPASETVIVEYMPRQHRASHTAAGNRGAYPHNGAHRIRVSAECADQMVELDGEWCEIVE